MTQLQSKPTEEKSAGKPALALDIEGMTCAACATRIENVVRRVPGVTAANVNFPTETAYVSGTEAPAEIEAAVKRAGYGVKPPAPAKAAPGVAGLATSNKDQ